MFWHEEQIMFCLIDFIDRNAIQIFDIVQHHYMHDIPFLEQVSCRLAMVLPTNGNLDCLQNLQRLLLPKSAEFWQWPTTSSWCQM
jgi:hypothetical protein